LAQYSLALGVLAERSRTLPGTGIEDHQLAVCGLVQWAQGQPAPSVGDRCLVLATTAMPPRQPLQGISDPVAQPLGLKELPLVERRGVGEGKAGKKPVLV
jgi:hypothetical protein